MGDVTDFSQLHGRGHRRARVRQAQEGDRPGQARPAGCEILAGGEVDDSVGWFVRPTVVEGGDPTDEMFGTEYFGPILAVHVFDDGDFERSSSRWSPSRRTP